jgi:hypothetical protein
MWNRRHCVLTMMQMHCGSAVCSAVPLSERVVCHYSAQAFPSSSGKSGFQGTVQLLRVFLLWMFNELYFKYQRLLNKDNVCFFIYFLVFINSEYNGRASCICIIPELFPKAVSGHILTYWIMDGKPQKHSGAAAINEAAQGRSLILLPDSLFSPIP